MRAPAVPRLPRAGLVLVALLAACGPAGAQTTPTATPLPTSQLQERYQAAAAAYNTAEGPVLQAENEYCAPAAPTADVMHCETALSADRQATITFDKALRALTFPPSARGVVTQLLSDDAQLETLLEQAATAPSLSAISALTPQIFQLLTTASHDAIAVRTAIGISSTSPSPA